MRRMDLHLHTTASDGTLTPEETLTLAAEKGLTAVAITDHDTVDGYVEGRATAERLGLELIPGIEISTKYGRSVHILGYYIDPKATALVELTDWIIQDRDGRNRRMAEMMAADGLPVDYDMMRQRFGAVIGRPHFAELLVDFGLARSMKDAFDRYVEKGQKYYQPRTVLSIQRSIETIVQSGGVAVLAHPFQYRLDDAGLRELIEHCMALGLTGMECRYSGYTQEQEDYLEALAGEYSLIKTGGSDFHGSHKPQIKLGSGTGRLAVPFDWLQALKQAAGCS